MSRPPLLAARYNGLPAVPLEEGAPATNRLEQAVRAHASRADEASREAWERAARALELPVDARHEPAPVTPEQWEHERSCDRLEKRARLDSTRQAKRERAAAAARGLVRRRSEGGLWLELEPELLRRALEAPGGALGIQIAPGRETIWWEASRIREACRVLAPRFKREGFKVTIRSEHLDRDSGASGWFLSFMWQPVGWLKFRSLPWEWFSRPKDLTFAEKQALKNRKPPRHKPPPTLVLNVTEREP